MTKNIGKTSEYRVMVKYTDHNNMVWVAESHTFWNLPSAQEWLDETDYSHYDDVWIEKATWKKVCPHPEYRYANGWVTYKTCVECGDIGGNDV